MTVVFGTDSPRTMLFTSLQWALCDNSAGALCDCTTLEYPAAQKPTHASLAGVAQDSFTFTVTGIPDCPEGGECWCLCIKAKAVIDPGFKPVTIPTTATINLVDGGASSYFQTTVSNAGILNGTYPGWCVDTDRSIYFNTKNAYLDPTRGQSLFLGLSLAGGILHWEDAGRPLASSVMLECDKSNRPRHAASTAPVSD